METNKVRSIRKKFLSSLLPVLLLSSAPLCVAQETSGFNPVMESEFTVPQVFNTSDNSNLDGFEVRSLPSTIHNVLGYTTVAMGLMTGFLNPEAVGEDVHQAFGYASSALAAATLGSGFIAHLKDIDMSSGPNSNNVHMILGIAGGSMMMLAPFLAPSDAHKVFGELGALTMGLSIVGKYIY